VSKFLFCLLLSLTVALLLPFAASAVCTITSSAVNFGTYDIFSSTPLDTTGQVAYRCGGSDRNITITLDTGGASSFNPRRMLNGTQTLNYNLYLDAARTIIWGDGTGGTQTYFIGNPPNNQNVMIPMYGRVPTGQGVGPGTYSNTITVTINF
jgi:spore coat protein U-like protein